MQAVSTESVLSPALRTIAINLSVERSPCVEASSAGDVFSVAITHPQRQIGACLLRQLARIRLLPVVVREGLEAVPWDGV